MKRCPECGQGVPFGGARTAENAHQMYEMVRMLSARLKPGEEGKGARQFVDQGRRLADSLHAYGHKQTTTNPDWASAGLWMRQAKGI